MLKESNIDAMAKTEGILEPVPTADFVMEHGELKMYREDGFLVHVAPKSVRFEVLLKADASVLARHFSANKVLNKLKRPEMIKDIHKWTKKCKPCFVSNPGKTVVSPLTPSQMTKPYEIIGVDILELERTTSGNRNAVTGIDHFSKLMAAYPVEDKRAKTAAKGIFYRWIADGCRWPKVILV